MWCFVTRPHVTSRDVIDQVISHKVPIPSSRPRQSGIRIIRATRELDQNSGLASGREALLVASGAAERAAEHCGGGPKLPSAAEFGSFGRVSPTPAQLHSRQRRADPPPDR
ncbi:hypothetical protein PGT21_017463 [Puccinia graminis f. sp. tritici]|uniref:Uncharacterized protein n=1 Tax=Puccinia graminis f. sp. tritici TaxID=56615 RepID=A0A5B0NUQ1_PUCGR|nr:hypothetical protein PGT21_017463 [Puccinia graminis f. sp. tritici]